MATATESRRTRVELGIYQPNGRLAVCARHAGRLHFRTCDGDLEADRRARLAWTHENGAHVDGPERRPCQQMPAVSAASSTK